MKPLEQILSPMVKNRIIISQNVNQSDVLLLEKIRQQKIDLVNQRINSSQVDLVRPEVAESWIRSYKFGLDLFGYNYGPILDKPVFQELARKKHLLLKAADPYIRQLETMLSNSECIILLSDEKGAMLRVVEGSHELLQRQNKRFRLVPGSVWTEETVGTCAHGISLITGNPMQICGPEHYSETYEEISCSSAAIFDINNNLAGTLCIVTPSFHHQSSQSLGLVVSMAWAVQNEYQLALSNKLLSVTLEAADEAVITINKSGIITQANMTARKMLHYLHKELVGMHYEAVFGYQPEINAVLETGKPIFDMEIATERYHQQLHLRSVQPVRDHWGNNFGCVLTLKPINRIRKAVSPVIGAEAKFTFDKIIGSSPQLMEAINMAKKFARLDANILIQGESGTGKEVFAQAIHNDSRSDGPFMAVNCAAIPKTLIESELLGYEGGAFTGAERQGRPGKIELANHGTLFLDEIGDMPLELQPVLLRVLEEKQVMRVGGSRYIPVDFRLVTATNKDLLDLAEKGQFREDLYYRLKVLKISIPPLRERDIDIIRLARYFAQTIASKQQIPLPSFSDLAILQLVQYNWPGNIRQLENAILYAVTMCDGQVIRNEDLPEEVRGEVVESQSSTTTLPANKLSIKEMERIMIIQALLQTDNNISEAADILGTSRSTLYRKIKEYNLTTPL